MFQLHYVFYNVQVKFTVYFRDYIHIDNMQHHIEKFICCVIIVSGKVNVDPLYTHTRLHYCMRVCVCMYVLSIKTIEKNI